jgi:uncharacterized protein
VTQTSNRPGLAAVPWHAVEFDDAFWSPRLRVLRERTLPALHRQCLSSGRIAALRQDWQPGMPARPHPYWDSDIAKWLEASSYSLATHPDPDLQAIIDGVVQLLQSAQQPDGYLNTYITAVDPTERWTDLRDGHELYCAGHLIEAGVAEFLASGRRSLLDVVCRYADYLVDVFGTGSGQKHGYCGHPEIELALLRLYRATDQAKYLELSRYFVDERGQQPYFFDLEGAERNRPRANDSYYRRNGLRGLELRRYNQSHAPVRQQLEVVGHAVRAMYLYSAMADIAVETGDTDLLLTCERLWSHMLSTRVYLTGGIGSSAHNEGFSNDFDLPNATAYAETCASVGLVGWAHRMLALTGDGQYADLLERTLYNSVASAMGSDGERFFYANPLASAGDRHRQSWFDVACCPPNLARLLAALGQYMYSHNDTDIAVHLFARSTTVLQVAGQRVIVRQSTDYPWDGRIRMDLAFERPTVLGFRVRVPSWCREATVLVNDIRVPHQRAIERGYLRIDRSWSDGDRVDVYFPMPVQRIYAHPSVADNVGRVALQRGPIVYRLEHADNPIPLDSVRLPRSAPISTTFDAACLGGVVKLHVDGLLAEADDWGARLYRADAPARLCPQPLVAVPYAVWDNRSPGQMRVWINEAGSDDSA